MNEQFVPYELTLQLRELGLDCTFLAQWQWSSLQKAHFISCDFSPTCGKFLGAPLWQQAFDFFKERYGFFGYVHPVFSVPKYETRFGFTIDGCGLKGSSTIFGRENFPTPLSHDEARQACLEKLIEVVRRVIQDPPDNKTTNVVREAMRIVSKDVRSPKVVRDGTVKPTATR